MSDKKRTYESPAIVREGDVRDLTLAHRNGRHYDRMFPVNTPAPLITLS